MVDVYSQKRNILISCSKCEVTNCFVKICKKESFELIDQHKTIERQNRLQFIFREGNPVYGIHIIQNGKAKVVSTGYNGKMQIIRLAKNGQILGHRSLGYDVYTVSAIAIDDSTLCFIDGKLLGNILRSDINLTYHFMLFYSNELRAAESRMKNLAQMTVNEKVAEALLIVSKQFGTPIENGILLDVDLSRNDYGELSSLRYEQVTRVLSDFKKELIIDYSQDKKIILLQPQTLQKMTAPYYAHAAE